MMQRYVVSATRIEKNPWRYAAVPGFEVLSRASEHDTNWLLDALRRGLWLENKLMPSDWLPEPQVPYTVIVDDTDISAVPAGQLHAHPTVLSTPSDSLTWGDLSDSVNLSTDSVGSQDSDTLATNYNLYGVNTGALMDSTISLERLGRCTPPLPKWLIAGLLSRDCGVFREAFSLIEDDNGLAGGPPRVRSAAGPGTLWVSVRETERLLKALGKNAHDPGIGLPPLRILFEERAPRDEGASRWESEAALFVRWGLMGNEGGDPALTRAFLELVRRARREPVTERVFRDCLGFGYNAMEGKLVDFLKTVIAKPTSVRWDMPGSLLVPVNLKEATSDQIGRILGDWLRMKGEYLRSTDSETSEAFISASGRMLERAYREDNGLPPDVDPSRRGAVNALPPQNAGLGSPVVMKPFIVAANRIHDPGLLAVYGLYEHDIGEDDKARELLEAALRTGVVRPRANFALAELRYAQAIAKPEGADAELSAQQAASILGPLRAPLQSAPTSDVFRLVVKTWANCEGKPSEGDVAAVVKGVESFPRDAELAYNSALLCSRSGYAAQADKLIDLGLVFATREVNRDYFEQLRPAQGGPPPE